MRYFEHKYGTKWLTNSSLFNIKDDIYTSIHNKSNISKDKKQFFWELHEAGLLFASPYKY